MKKEKYQIIFQKPMETYSSKENKPLLLFVTWGYDDEKGMRFVRINGLKNPLPIKEAYGINIMHLVSWLNSHGWKEIGHRNMYDL